MVLMRGYRVVLTGVNHVTRTRMRSENFSNHIRMTSRFALADRYRGADKNVWVEFSRLAAAPGVVNIGQGFPDLTPPRHVRDALSNCVTSSNILLNQYTRAFGHPRLVQVLARMFSPLLAHEIDWQTEILISIGAYGCLYNAIQGIVNPGDEIIVIEPYFDCYKPMVEIAGGTVVYIPLRPTAGSGSSSADWRLDSEELKQAFTARTKAIIVNNPNNPLGKVFHQEELQEIADLCHQHNVLCISDEVYEWLVYKPNKHVRMATLPGMWDRTLTIGSAGKTFSVTGWKLGWTIGPAELLKPSQTVHQNSIYVCPTPLQEAIAVGLELESARLDHDDCYFRSLPVQLQPKRDRLAENLRQVGIKPIVPEGGYFMIADTSDLDINFDDDDDAESSKDYKFARWLIKHKKLACIPPSAFYGPEHKHLAQNYIRFCFIKEDSTMEKAAGILKEWAASGT